MNAAEERLSHFNEKAEAVENEDEDDFTGYFLQPTANNVDIVERIAEANRKLYSEDELDKENAERPKKVQFSERLVNFEPENYDSDDLVGSDRGNSTMSEDNEDEPQRNEEGLETSNAEKALKRSHRPKTAHSELKKVEDAIIEETEAKTEIPEEVSEEIESEAPKPDDREDESQQMKVLLVMLPREQSSSCESVIGEEIIVEKSPSEDRSESDPHAKREESVPKEETPERKPLKTVRAHTPNSYKISKISPDLNCPVTSEPKRWQSKQGQRCNTPKKGGEMGKKTEACKGKSGAEEAKKRVEGVTGAAATASPSRRSCCAVRTGLPNYNGLRSEYGLSAEQLQERRRKTFELRQQKRLDKMKKRQEEIRRRIENDENFSQWLYRKKRCPNVKRPAQVDTLSRSDVYIQNHAVYASRRGVSYSVEYGLGRKRHLKTTKVLLFDRKHDKGINIERLFDVSPNITGSYRIYLGNGEK